MVNRDVLLLDIVVDTLNYVHNLFASFGYEAIVVRGIASHMHSELLCILARWSSFSHTDYVFKINDSLDRFLVNVNHGRIRDYKGSLLCPLEHICLLDLSGKYKLI